MTKVCRKLLHDELFAQVTGNSVLREAGPLNDSRAEARGAVVLSEELDHVLNAIQLLFRLLGG